MKKAEMTSRGRVMASLNHQEPDRVPIDLGQATGDGITLGAYRNLLRHLGMDASRIQVKDKRGQTARVDEEVLQRFRVDVRGMGLGSPENWKDVWLDEHTYQDEWGVVRTMPAGSLYYDLVRAPLAEEEPYLPSSDIAGPIPPIPAASGVSANRPVTFTKRPITPSSWT